MNARLPIRDRFRDRETESILFLRQHLPPGWTWDTLENDYGIDARIGVVRGGAVTGWDLLVQLKSAEDPLPQPYERIRLPVSTYNYLMANLSVAMLVKYIAAEREAYWDLLRDVSAPNQARETFTVRIPRANRISALDWDRLLERIAAIHDAKISAGREQL